MSVMFHCIDIPLEKFVKMCQMTCFSNSLLTIETEDENYYRYERHSPFLLDRIEFNRTLLLHSHSCDFTLLSYPCLHLRDRIFPRKFISAVLCYESSSSINQYAALNFEYFVENLKVLWKNNGVLIVSKLPKTRAFCIFSRFFRFFSFHNRCHATGLTETCIVLFLVSEFWWTENCKCQVADFSVTFFDLLWLR